MQSNPWKDVLVVPVPNCSGPKTINDFRAVDLTSVLLKILEILVSSILTIFFYFLLVFYYADS